MRREMHRRLPTASIVICAVLLAGCGGSHDSSLDRQRAAIAAAQRIGTNLGIFPTSAGTIRCRLSGPVTVSFWGRCTTKVSPRRSGTEVAFVVSARHAGRDLSGSWSFVVDSRDRARPLSAPVGWFPPQWAVG